ncbi:MAG: hypothetical protein ACYSX0_20005 [Planctomycetota bacterium]|jgi:hypothetical protein
MSGSVNKLLVTLATGAIVLGAAETAHACQICYPFPKKSIVDHLTECDSVVLAREDPQRPFHFRAIELLKGIAPKEPIDLFLDSVTRRILKFHPDRSVLLAKAGQGAWRRLALVDATLMPVVRDILKRAPNWQLPNTARFEYFARLFGHDHPQIRDLAHLEVARAPYSDIRRLGRSFPRAKVLAGLRDPRYVEWWALHILLLAQSGDARDQQRIIESLRSAERFESTMQLGAWATAFIEIEGEKAIEFLESRYFRGSRRVEELNAVAAALSVHGSSGRTELRDRIVASYEVLLTQHPAMAPRIVGDLLAWRRWEMAEMVQRAADRCTKTLQPDALNELRWFSAMAAKARRAPVR